MNLEDASAFLNHRPNKFQVYYPDLHQIDMDNSLLLWSAVMTFMAGYPQGDFAHNVKMRLAQEHGGSIRDFSVRPLGGNFGQEFLLICSTVARRNQILTDGGLLVIQPDVVVRFTRWNRSHGCVYEPPSFWTRVRIMNVPLHLYNPSGISFLTSGFGTPIRVAPHFSDGNFESLRILVKGCHPVYIPRFVAVSQDPYVKLAEVVVEGFLQVWPFNEEGPYYGPGMPWEPPQEQNDDERVSSNYPSSGTDYTSNPPFAFLTGEHNSWDFCPFPGRQNGSKPQVRISSNIPLVVSVQGLSVVNVRLHGTVRAFNLTSDAPIRGPLSLPPHVSLLVFKTPHLASLFAKATTRSASPFILSEIQTEASNQAPHSGQIDESNQTLYSGPIEESASCDSPPGFSGPPAYLNKGRKNNEPLRRSERLKDKVSVQSGKGKRPRKNMAQSPQPIYNMKKQPLAVEQAEKILQLGGLKLTNEILNRLATHFDIV